MDIRIRALLSGIAKDLFIGHALRIAFALSILAVMVAAGGILWGLGGSRSRPSFSLERLSALAKVDRQGTGWTLELTHGQPLGRIGQSGQKPGEPLLIKTDMVRTRTGEYSFGLSVIGQAGERYSGAVSRNGKRLPPPRFDIVDRQGRILASGVFEYG
jgi:hypothetical protein